MPLEFATFSNGNREKGVFAREKRPMKFQGEVTRNEVIRLRNALHLRRVNASTLKSYASFLSRRIAITSTRVRQNSVDLPCVKFVNGSRTVPNDRYRYRRRDRRPCIADVTFQRSADYRVLGAVKKKKKARGKRGGSCAHRPAVASGGRTRDVPCSHCARIDKETGTSGGKGPREGSDRVFATIGRTG